MINPFREVNWTPGIPERRSFARSIAIGLPLIALIFGTAGWLRARNWPGWTWWLAAIGGGLGVALWCAPRFARPFYIAWMTLGCAIGLLVSNVLVAAVYFLVVTPTGLVMRLCGRDPLRLHMERESASYWEDAEKPGDAARYFRQH